MSIEFNVAGIEFIAAVLLAASVFFWLPGARLRQAFWASGNLLVLWLVLPTSESLATWLARHTAIHAATWLVLPNPASLATLAVFLGSGYLVARLLQKRPSSWLLSSYIALLVAAFVVLKQYALLDWVLPRALLQSPLRVLGLEIRDGVLQHVVKIAGLSYMLFRQIHVLVDAAEGQIERLSLWSYVNYQVNLFTLLAGPIQRYQDFDEQWRKLQPVLADPHELLQNCLRLLLGVLKIALLAPLFYKGWDELQAGLVYRHVTGWKFIAEFPVVFYFYPLYLYLNFAGYCDIVIAASRFFGMKLPENFHRPWLARNVIEFWTRWHITLGTWIRDYLFMPMYKPVVERWPQRAQSLAWIFYFLAFAVAGAWHGTTLNFLCYGIWQGFGMSCTKLYENWLLARRGRAGLRTYLQSPSIRLAAIVLNFHFQCLSMLIFSQRDVDDAWQIVRGLFLALAGR
jgi:D-alanyl-lipoteichoic acid acyltransferase DltB (MBOAT superfamily)